MGEAIIKCISCRRVLKDTDKKFLTDKTKTLNTYYLCEHCYSKNKEIKNGRNDFPKRDVPTC